MKKKSKRGREEASKLFQELIVRKTDESEKMVSFYLKDDPEELDLAEIGLLNYVCLSIYGVPEEATFDDLDFDDDEEETVVKIGEVTGWHVPVDLIQSVGYDPHEICDEESADLEAMFAIVTEFDLLEMNDCIFYIDEIELDEKHNDPAYEKAILKRLPIMISGLLNVYPTLFMYFPPYTEKGVARMEATAEKKGALPDTKKITELQDKRLIRLYTSCDFKPAGDTGWLFLKVMSIP